MCAEFSRWMTFFRHVDFGRMYLSLVGTIHRISPLCILPRPICQGHLASLDLPPGGPWPTLRIVTTQSAPALSKRPPMEGWVQSMSK